MKVKELIAKLQEFDGELEVYVPEGGSENFDNATQVVIAKDSGYGWTKEVVGIFQS